MGFIWRFVRRFIWGFVSRFVWGFIRRFVWGFVFGFSNVFVYVHPSTVDMLSLLGIPVIVWRFE